MVQQMLNLFPLHVYYSWCVSQLLPQLMLPNKPPQNFMTLNHEHIASGSIIYTGLSCVVLLALAEFTHMSEREMADRGWP